MVWPFAWLCLLLFLPSPLYSSSSSSLPFTRPSTSCHPHEGFALLHFRNSFSIINNSYLPCRPEYGGIANPNSTMSWDRSRDCCTWSGVTCDDVTGDVIRLDLECGGLQGVIHSNNSLFSLTHLQALILSSNYFYGSKISPQFVRFGSMIHLDLSDSGFTGQIHSNNSLFSLTRLQTLILSFNDFDGLKISPQFARFRSMIHLDLSDSGFTGQVPLEFSYLSSLVTLDLSWNWDLRLETFSLKRIVANLTSLRELSLSGVNMSNISPNSFMNLSAPLTSLDLSDSELKGEFPENIFHLPNLQDLELSYNYNLNGSFPRYNWTSQLRNLSLSSTRFLLDLPYLTRNLKYLNHLDVRSCIFKGSFPSLLGNLTQITSLDISSNNFGGQIPWDSFNLAKLQYLRLSDNNFVGQLPEICNSTKQILLCDSSKHQLVGPVPSNLKSLVLYSNSLNGTIPSWLCSLPSLQNLYLSQNQFTGHIGEFQYNSLVELDLSSNKLWGLIPRSIFEQVNLVNLGLSSNNLSGVVRLDQVSKLKNLKWLDLSFNSLSTDSVNSVTSVLPNTLWYLHMSSCNVTGFPYSLRSLENLEYLDLSNNRIGGSVPQWLWNVGKDSLYFLNISHNLLTHIGQIPWKSLNYIDLSSNKLQGHFPIPPPSTFFFSISNNQLVGEISSSFCNLHGFEVLNLSNNSLSGNIPPCFGNNTPISVLDLRLNRFHGTIPNTFAKGNYLRTLTLNGNQLEGPLPQSLVNCESLEVLDVGNNKLNGSFPFWLESLPELQVLILRSNAFSGPISNPKVEIPFQKLRIIDLSNNEFTGVLPSKYFQNFDGMMDIHTDDLEYMNYSSGSTSYYQDTVVVVMKGIIIELVKIQTMFVTIDFSRNHFTGEIPELIGKLNSLKGLNLSHNTLTGVIPPLLGNLINLEWLDLSSNNLSSKIPLQLEAGLNQLGFLNLSNNKLEGPIPQGKQFNTFNNDSYSGNAGLCGFPLSKSCGNDEAQHDQDDNHDDDDEEDNNGMIEWKAVMMGYGSGMVIGISVGYMVLFSRSFDYWFLKRFGRGGRRKSNACRARRRSN